MKTKIIIGILALVAVAALIFYFKLPSTPPVIPPVTTTTVPTATTTIVSTALGENQAYSAIDQELGSAVQGISSSDVQNAMTS